MQVLREIVKRENSRFLKMICKVWVRIMGELSPVGIGWIIGMLIFYAAANIHGAKFRYCETAGMCV